MNLQRDDKALIDRTRNLEQVQPLKFVLPREGHRHVPGILKEEMPGMTVEIRETPPKISITKAQRRQASSPEIHWRNQFRLILDRWHRAIERYAQTRQLFHQ